MGRNNFTLQVSKHGGRPATCFIQHNSQRVVQALKPAGADDLVIRKLKQSRAQSHQVTGQIPTVYGGNIKRVKWVQRKCVVPIVKVSLMPLHSLQGVQGVRGSLQQHATRNVAKVIGGQVSQQRHSDIGGRGAMCHRRPAIFLIIVGRQPVIFRPHKGLKEGPGFTRNFFQKYCLLSGQFRFATSYRRTYPPRNGGRQGPQY